MPTLARAFTPNTNQEPAAANRFMRTTHARELNTGWDVHHGEKSGRMTNYYAQVSDVCSGVMIMVVVVLVAVVALSVMVCRRKLTE